MAYENLCMYCFKDLSGSDICPHCGKDANAAVPQIQLLPGSRLHHERFLVGRSLGQDSSGIVYNALDTKRGNTIKIREYLPRNCAERLNDGGVVPVAGMEDAFEAGMRKLKASVENAEDSQKKHFYFEENGTAYIAQRRSAAINSSAIEESDPDDEPSGRKTGILIGIGVVLAAVAVIAVLLFMNGGKNGDKTAKVLPSASPTSDPNVTWMPAATPTPTPYATATFEPLVDPELSWFEFATANSTAVNATATPKPSVNTGTSYTTVNQESASSNVKQLQQRLAELGWLDRSRVSGNYDSATKQAVMNFQNYVNENCSPATKLVVDGIAGSKTQQWLYSSSVALYKPTPTPEPIVTAVPDTAVVKAGSPAKEVKAVQRKLIVLGLLPSGSADGKFGTDTKAAVRNFQTRVNQLRGYDVLDVSGVVDDLTMAYLDYYVAWWQTMVQATATPVNTNPTPTPVQPTATIIPATAAPEGGETISKASSPVEIRALQKNLVQVGLLENTDVDGVYGKKTVAAVTGFQSWINTNRGARTLEVTGNADPLTQQYIDYCVSKGIKAVSLNTPQASEAPTLKPTEVPTETPTVVPTEVPTVVPTEIPTEIPTEVPTEEPTAEPTPEVYEPEAGEGENDMTGINASSAPESISYMQEMLKTIRLLPEDAVNGSYDERTTDAISIFQMFVNKVQGDGTLQVTGMCDEKTQQYLQYAYDRSWDVGTDMGVEFGGGSQESTEPTVMPGETENVDPAEVQQMLCNVGLMEYVSGSFDRETAQAVMQAQRFINSVYGAETVPETGSCDETTLQYLRLAAQEGWNMGDTGDMPQDNDNPGGDDPQVPIETAPESPTAEPAPMVTDEPIAEITNFNVAVNSDIVGETVELDSGKYTISWSADGVQAWSLYLYIQDGTLVKKVEYTPMNSFVLDTAGMVSGAVYEMRLGAIPTGGGAEDIVWRSLYISLKTPAPIIGEDTGSEIEPEVQTTQEPVPEPTEEPYIEPITPEPTAEPYVGAPVITIGSAVYQQGGITYINDATVIFAWMADGDVASYDVALIYEDGTRYTLGTTNDTSKTVNASQLQPGMYTLVVAANPIGGGAPVSSQIVFCVPSNEPTVAETVPSENIENSGYTEEITQGSDVPTVNEEVKNIQMALYRYGLINPDNITEGVLDYETLAAVAQFQQRANEVGGYNLPVLDPGSATSIDLETLNVLLNEKPAL